MMIIIIVDTVVVVVFVAITITSSSSFHHGLFFVVIGNLVVNFSFYFYQVCTAHFTFLSCYYFVCSCVRVCCC